METNVDCLKTHMQVKMTFSNPFNGYIYPHNAFARCLLFTGQNSHTATMVLKHGTCGDEERVIHENGRTHIDPVINHRIVIQWDRELVGEDDSSVIVRCERPDDYNKTISWDLGLQELVPSALKTAKHEGPKMYMEIQRGEGPNAPPLDSADVYVGDTLTLIFTLSDNVYWFDSNILTCFAVDGGEQKQAIEWYSKDVSANARVYSGETQVTQNDCSVKPKLFSHFFKERVTPPNGDLITLHYAYFKAFCFPTSHRIVIQCNVQVCYKECEPLPPCVEAFTPRLDEVAQRRRRRAAEQHEEAQKEGAHALDNVDMYKSVEVLQLEEAGIEKVPYIAPAPAPVLTAPIPSNPCYTPDTVFGVAIGLVTVIVVLLIVIMLQFFRARSGFANNVRTWLTPRKAPPPQ